ncbi:MAG: response regulator [Planctomycetes bacterium]|nr:response regulator [Planctomycetota bacterium]
MSTKTILLVDDDHDFLEMTSHVLEAAGYRVATTSDPSAALGLIATEKPALVVSDLMMKALDSGFSLARAIKADERFRGVPVILVTAIASRLGLDFTPRTPADLAAMGADAFFEKPITPTKLLAEIERLLRANPR